MHQHVAHAGEPAGASGLNWLPAVFVAMLIIGYLLAQWRATNKGRPWPWWRTCAWLLGFLTVARATHPVVSMAAHDDLKAHMVQHLVLGLFAPLALIHGAPVTLLLRALPTDGARIVTTVMKSPPVRAVSHPVAALVLNLGGMYVLYLTPLFSWTMSTPALHMLMNAHFLLAGYVFAWSIAGPDPVPRRPGLMTRLSVLVVSMGLHAFLGKLMYAHLLPAGTQFGAAEIQDAAVTMYYGGDIAELLLAITLFGSWYGHRKRKHMKLTDAYGATPERGQQIASA